MTKWEIEEAPVDDYVLAPPTPLASLVYLVRELRRRRHVWVATALVGLALAGLYAWQVPPKAEATVTLYLEHPSGTDALTAMQTDVTILRTRAVAERTVARLGLHTAPLDFLHTYDGTATTPNVLTITVQAGTPAAALRTAKALSSTYLDYRSQQLEASSDAQIAGVHNQIMNLQAALSDAERQYTHYHSGPTATDQTLATAALQQEASLRSQIGTLQAQQQSAEDATGAVIKASNVLDPAAVLPPDRMRGVVETLFSGGVGGLAVGSALVALTALTTTRLRRREDVALAAGAPVTHSVRRLGRGLHTTLSRGPRRPRASHNLQVLAQGLEAVVDTPGVHRTALLTLGNERQGLLVAAFAGAQLSSDRREVFLTDLSESGRLEPLVRRAAGAVVRPTVAPTVYRPPGIPALARGPMADGRTTPAALGPNDPQRARWDAAEVSIAMASVDLDLGLDHIAGWASTAVLLVTAGAASAEQIGTATGLLRSAGVAVVSVLLVGTDRGDHSFGRSAADEEAKAQPEAADGGKPDRKKRSRR